MGVFGARDGRNHIAAVAEGEQREVDAEHLADGRFHQLASREVRGKLEPERANVKSTPISPSGTPE